MKFLFYKYNKNEISLMNNLIKHIVEAFDFDSVNKQKKVVNAYDMILFPIINKIKHYKSLSKDEYNI